MNCFLVQWFSYTKHICHKPLVYDFVFLLFVTGHTHKRWNSFVDIWEVNRQAIYRTFLWRYISPIYRDWLHPLGTRWEDDFLKVFNTTPNTLKNLQYSLLDVVQKNILFYIHRLPLPTSVLASIPSRVLSAFWKPSPCLHQSRWRMAESVSS